MFFVVSIQRTGDSNPVSIFAYDTKEQAFSVYHQTLASNYMSETLDGFCALVLNEHGGTEAREYWDRPQTAQTVQKATMTEETLPVEAEVPEESAE